VQEALALGREPPQRRKAAADGADAPLPGPAREKAREVLRAARNRRAQAVVEEETQLRGLNTTSIGNLTDTQVAALTSTEVVLLSATQIGALSSTEVQSFTTTQASGALGSNIIAPLHLADRKRDKIRVSSTWTPIAALPSARLRSCPSECARIAARRRLALGPHLGALTIRGPTA